MLVLHQRPNQGGQWRTAGVGCLGPRPGTAITAHEYCACLVAAKRRAQGPIDLGEAPAVRVGTGNV
jgi:hypothetical protein